jgi:hypothetical protein
MYWMYRAAQVVCRERQEGLPRFIGCAGSDDERTTLKIKTLLLVILLGLTTACSAPVIQDKAGGEFAAKGLYPVQYSGFAEAYARPDAGLPGYHKVDIQTLDVSNIDIPDTMIAGTLKRDWEMTPQRQAALQQSWEKAMDKAFSRYERAADGTGVLRIAAKLTRIAPGRPTATTIGGALPQAGASRDVLEIWAEFRLFDGADGKLLAVIRDNRTMSSMAMSRTAPVGMTMMLDSWAALLHTRVSGK